MNLETFSALVKQARQNRERTSDHLLTFEDVERRLKFDRSAEKLLVSCMMLPFRRSPEERLN